MSENNEDTLEDTSDKNKHSVFCSLLPSGPIPFASILLKREKVCDDKKLKQKPENLAIDQVKGKEKVERSVLEVVQRRNKFMCQKKSGQVFDTESILNEDRIYYREIETTRLMDRNVINESDE